MGSHHRQPQEKAVSNILIRYTHLKPGLSPMRDRQMFWSTWKYSPPKRVFQMLALYLGEADGLEPATPKPATLWISVCTRSSLGERESKHTRSQSSGAASGEMRCESNHHPSDKDHSRHALANEDTPANEVEASQVVWSQTQKKLIWLWFLFYSHPLIVWLGKKVYKNTCNPSGTFLLTKAFNDSVVKINLTTTTYLLLIQYECKLWTGKCPQSGTHCSWAPFENEKVPELLSWSSE